MGPSWPPEAINFPVVCSNPLSEDLLSCLVAFSRLLRRNGLASSSTGLSPLGACLNNTSLRGFNALEELRPVLDYSSECVLLDDDPVRGVS